MHVRLTAGIHYEGRHRDPGELLEVPDQLGHLLLQANRAERFTPSGPALEEVPAPAGLEQIARAGALEEPPRRRRR